MPQLSHTFRPAAGMRNQRELASYQDMDSDAGRHTMHRSVSSSNALPSKAPTSKTSGQAPPSYRTAGPSQAPLQNYNA